mgnify:CR=1 FL=1
MPALPFYLLSALTAGCALGSVLNRNTITAAFCLLGSLLGLAGLFVLLDAYLLAALLVMVYAGAIVALFVFIVMLLDMQGGNILTPSRISLAAAVVAAAVLGTGLGITFGHHLVAAAPAAAAPAGIPSLKLYGYQLFTTYLLPVQIIGFLLLIAMLGVIVISKRFTPAEDVK